ncbi:MAG: TetR/AcrR family transcriptional regulator [Desulfurobacteriaceae bacterium]
MKERILEAAEKVFSEKGFYDAKISKIAEIAGVSVGTIYRFYKSKEELYGEVIKKKLVEMENRVKKAIENKPPVEALSAYVSTILDFFSEEKNFFEIFMRELGSSFIIDTERFNLSLWYRDYVNELSGIIEKGVKDGIFKNYSPQGVFLLISGALASINYFRLKEFISLRSEEVKKLILDVVLEGLIKK